MRICIMYVKGGAHSDESTDYFPPKYLRCATLLFWFQLQQAAVSSKKKSSDKLAVHHLHDTKLQTNC